MENRNPNQKKLKNKKSQIQKKNCFLLLDCRVNLKL
jgi:hypothetical protein